MIRKSIGLLAGMLVTVAVYAAGVQLRANHPDSYTVRRGDTLWSISARFLSKPWLWPEIWQANPQVHNPHLIYPGDVLNLSLSSGGPFLQLQPSVRHEANPIPAIPLDRLKTFLDDLRVVDSDQLRTSPYVVAIEENQLRGTVGQNLYVRKLVSQPGERWAIVRPTHVFRAYNAKGSLDDRDIVGHTLDSNVALVRTPWSEDFRNDGHYGRGKDLGVEVTVIGTAETLRTGDPSTLLLLKAAEEIRPGDRVLPLDGPKYDPYYYPHPPKSLPANGRVIAFTDALDAVGPHQVVALSVGSRDGVNDGTTFSIWQPGRRAFDDVAHDSWDRGTGRKVKLPDEFIGHVMVFRTFDRVSYGLVMDALRPVKLGDKLRMPE